MNTNLSIPEDLVLESPVGNRETSLVREIRLPAPVMFIEIDSPLDHTYNIVAKRLFDIMISAVFITALIAFLPLISLLIVADSKGPVFFRQKRMKKGGRYFQCLKFRTMISNAEADILAACENDHRITRVGKFLRRHHLDELPQLWNVLKGDMSLIGPRPYMISDSIRYEQVVDRYKLRYKVKPGITGLAQSYGHFGSVAGEMKMNERVNFDLQYITGWSLKMDMQILFRTILMMLKRG
jgi:putative colanic acid biosysnthesis UDP-glucose lipid carrier transferase